VSPGAAVADLVATVADDCGESVGAGAVCAVAQESTAPNTQAAAVREGTNSEGTRGVVFIGIKLTRMKVTNGVR